MGDRVQCDGAARSSEGQLLPGRLVTATILAATLFPGQQVLKSFKQVESRQLGFLGAGSLHV
jgi:hypothetical protein